MSKLETLWNSFEERNLVLQGLLGLLAFSEHAAAICSAPACATEAARQQHESTDQLVLLALGFVSFRDSLWAELTPDVAAGDGSHQSSQNPVRGASLSPTELLR
jgi:hypothetical protein